MDEATQQTLDTWREVCRHLQVADSVDNLAQILARALPLRRLRLRRFDGAQLVTIGVSGAVPVGATRTPIAPAMAAQLRGWGSRARARGWSATDDDELVRALTAGARLPETLVGPLVQDGALIGVVVVESDRALDARRLEPLLEPLSVALQNDQRLLELARLREAAEAENRALLARLQRQDISVSVVGAEAGLRGVMERVEQVARTDAPVLIFGETGSGKEVVARQVHERSRRFAAPFLRVNCGAIPTELVDSELFGHERGSFTGAVATRRGWFERADGGTLFLDELGELPPAAQVRLLRVLQDGTFERVGGADPITVDVRIIAATHRDLEAMITSGGFRADLWYRLSVFPITIPPLRERRDDIPALAEHFAATAGLRLFGVPLPIDAHDLAVLVRYPWRGNVRELAAVIERGAILGEGKRLDLQTALGASPPVLEAPAAATLDATTQRAVVDALRRCKGRIEGPFGAAQALGVNPHTLRSRMRKLGIDWSRYRDPATRDGAP